MPPPSPSQNTRCGWSWDGPVQGHTDPGVPASWCSLAPLPGLISQLSSGTPVHQTHLHSHHGLVRFPFPGPRPTEKSALEAGSSFHVLKSPAMAGRLFPTGHTGPLWGGHEPTQSDTGPARAGSAVGDLASNHGSTIRRVAPLGGSQQVPTSLSVSFCTHEQGLVIPALPSSYSSYEGQLQGSKRAHVLTRVTLMPCKAEVLTMQGIASHFMKLFPHIVQVDLCRQRSPPPTPFASPPSLSLPMQPTSGFGSNSYH